MFPKWLSHNTTFVSLFFPQCDFIFSYCDLYLKIVTLFLEIRTLYLPVVTLYLPVWCILQCDFVSARCVYLAMWLYISQWLFLKNLAMQLYLLAMWLYISNCDFFHNSTLSHSVSVHLLHLTVFNLKMWFTFF